MLPLLRMLKKKLDHSLFHRGLGGTILLAPRAAANLLRKRVLRRFTRRARQQRKDALTYDRNLGIDTYGDISLAALEIDSQNDKYGVQYQPTPPETFDRLLGLLPIDPGGYEFVDIGSGKGRVLFMAALHPFRKITGVEFSRELCAVAERNIARFSHPGQRCRVIESLCADATQYTFPRGPLVVYLFNPFAAPVMAPVLANLERSLKDDPRDVFVVYYNAVHRELFDRSPALVEVASDRVAEDDEPWAIYRARVGGADPSP